MKKFIHGLMLCLFLSTAVSVGQVVYQSIPTTADVFDAYGPNRGAAIAAQGQRTLSNSQAMINAEDAYSMALDNEAKRINYYWSTRDSYHERQQQEFDQIRQQRAAYMAKNNVGTLSASEFDRSSGAINWPNVLMQDQYAAYRNVMDEMFHKRAYEGALSGEDYLAATTASKEWRTMLGKQKNLYPAPVLSQMIRFILKINKELSENLG